MKRILTISFLTLLFGFSPLVNAGEKILINNSTSPSPAYVTEGTNAIVIEFLSAFKTKDKKTIATFFKYPLTRDYPLYSIDSPDELIAHFDEIFDQELTTLIENSDAQDDGVSSGWRGIMFDQGLVWMDYDGKIVAINHQSKDETIKRQEIINSMKRKLHPSLKNFVTPVLEFKTNQLLVRIDEMENNKYRYAAWPITGKQGDKPERIISDGRWFFDGSGGSYYITFSDDRLDYICRIYVISTENGPLGDLEVHKDEKTISRNHILEILEPNKAEFY